MEEKELERLVEKEIITEEELQEINEMSIVKTIESNGNSGKYHDKFYYTITTIDNKEYEIWS